MRSIEEIDNAIKRANRTRRAIEARRVPSAKDIARLEEALAAAERAYADARAAVYRAGEVVAPGSAQPTITAPFFDLGPAATVAAELATWDDSPSEADLDAFAAEVAQLRRQYAARRADLATAEDRLRLARLALHDAGRAVADRAAKLEHGATILQQLGREREQALAARARRPPTEPSLAQRAARLKAAAGGGG